MTTSAIVTGGGSGIGAAICRRLAASGTAVAVLDRDGGPAAEVAKDIEASGVAALACTVDVGDVEGVREAVEEAAETLGSIDIVVAAAGNMVPSAIADMSEGQWSSVIDTHLKGAFAVVSAAVPWLRLSEWPSVVLISSVAARGIAGNATYGAAKAGIAGLARSLAWELGSDGIRVNAVAPGFIDTQMTRRGALQQGISWEEFAARGVESTALGRIGTPADIAAAVDFFAGQDSGYVTGQVLYVSGAP